MDINIGLGYVYSLFSLCHSQANTEQRAEIGDQSKSSVTKFYMCLFSRKINI